MNLAKHMEVHVTVRMSMVYRPLLRKSAKQQCVLPCPLLSLCRDESVSELGVPAQAWSFSASQLPILLVSDVPASSAEATPAGAILTVSCGDIAAMHEVGRPAHSAPTLYTTEQNKIGHLHTCG